MGDKRIEITVNVIDVDEEKEANRQRLCKEYHEAFSDKDDICPYCGKCINEDF